MQKVRCTVRVILKDESFGVHNLSTVSKENYSYAHKSLTTRHCTCSIDMPYAAPQFFFFSLRCITDVLSATSVSPGQIQVLATLRFVMLHYVTNQNSFMRPKWVLLHNLYACVRWCLVCSTKYFWHHFVKSRMSRIQVVQGTLCLPVSSSWRGFWKRLVLVHSFAIKVSVSSLQQTLQ